MYVSNDFRLYHHGISGQKWGRRNGPPYPLSPAISTGSKLKTTSGRVMKQSGGLKDNRKLQREERKLLKAQKKADKAEKKELKRLQKEEEEKQKIIKSGDYDLVIKNQSRLSKEELKEAIDRIDLTRKVSKDTTPKPSTLDKMQNAKNTIDKTVELTKSGISAWNTFANIYNAVSSNDELPVIEPGWRQKKAAAEKQRKEDAFVRTATKEQFLNNAKNLSEDALKSRSNRETYLNTIRKLAPDSPTETPKQSKTSESSTKPKAEETTKKTNSWVRDDVNNPFWNASYRKVANTKMDSDAVQKGTDAYNRMIAHNMEVRNDPNNSYRNASYRKVANTKMDSNTIENGMKSFQAWTGSDEFKRMSARLP